MLTLPVVVAFQREGTLIDDLIESEPFCKIYFYSTWSGKVRKTKFNLSPSRVEFTFSLQRTIRIFRKLVFTVAKTMRLCYNTIKLSESVQLLQVEVVVYSMTETVRGTMNPLDAKESAAAACCARNISVTENSTDGMTDRELLRELQQMFIDDKGWLQKKRCLLIWRNLEGRVRNEQ